MPEWSKGVDSSSTVFALVGSNPTADKYTPFSNSHLPEENVDGLLVVTAFLLLFSSFDKRLATFISNTTYISRRT